MYLCIFFSFTFITCTHLHHSAGEHEELKAKRQKLEQKRDELTQAAILYRDMQIESIKKQCEAEIQQVNNDCEVSGCKLDGKTIEQTTDIHECCKMIAQDCTSARVTIGQSHGKEEVTGGAEGYWHYERLL